MITIEKNELKKLEKYYKYTPTPEIVDQLVDELADILEKSSGLETGIYQDMDDETYYRLYSGCSAVEIYLKNNVIQIDFDMYWQLGLSNSFHNSIAGI